MLFKFAVIVFVSVSVVGILLCSGLNIGWQLWRLPCRRWSSLVSEDCEELKNSIIIWKNYLIHMLKWINFSWFISNIFFFWVGGYLVLTVSAINQYISIRRSGDLLNVENIFGPRVDLNPGGNSYESLLWNKMLF